MRLKPVRRGHRQTADSRDPISLVGWGETSPGDPERCRCWLMKKKITHEDESTIHVWWAFMNQESLHSVAEWHAAIYHFRGIGLSGSLMVVLFGCLLASFSFPQIPHRHHVAAAASPRPSHPKRVTKPPPGARDRSLGCRPPSPSPQCHLSKLSHGFCKLPPRGPAWGLADATLADAPLRGRGCFWREANGSDPTI